MTKLDQNYLFGESEKKEILQKIKNDGFLSEQNIANENNCVVLVRDFSNQNLDYSFYVPEDIPNDENIDSIGKSISFTIKNNIKYLELSKNTSVDSHEIYVCLDVNEYIEELFPKEIENVVIKIEDIEGKINDLSNHLQLLTAKEENRLLKNLIKKDYTLDENKAKRLFEDSDAPKEGIKVNKVVLFVTDLSFTEGSKYIFPKEYEILESVISLDRYKDQLGELESFMEENTNLKTLINILRENKFKFANAYKYTDKNHNSSELIFKEDEIPDKSLILKF